MVFKEKKTLIFVIVVLVVFFMANYFRLFPSNSTKNVYSLPLTFGQWQGSDLTYDRELFISWLGTDQLIFRQYRNITNDHIVNLYLAYYPNMESSDMAHSPEVCYPGQGWEIKTNNDIDYILSGRKVHVKRMHILKNAEQEVVYSWWQTRNTIIAENSWYHLAQILNRICFLDTSSIWVRVSAEPSGREKNIGSAEDAVRAFCNDTSTLLVHYFQ